MGAPRIVQLYTRHHAQWWPLLAPWVERAIRRVHTSGVTLDDVREQTRNAHAGAFLVLDGATVIGAFVIRIELEAHRKVLRVWALAGTRLSEWIDRGTRILCRIGRQLGCRALVATGRRGWVRRLRSQGWRATNEGFELEA